MRHSIHLSTVYILDHFLLNYSVHSGCTSKRLGKETAQKNLTFICLLMLAKYLRVVTPMMSTKWDFPVFGKPLRHVSWRLAQNDCSHWYRQSASFFCTFINHLEVHVADVCEWVSEWGGRGWCEQGQMKIEYKQKAKIKLETALKETLERRKKAIRNAGRDSFIVNH